jgi:hypothetical protein
MRYLSIILIALTLFSGCKKDAPIITSPDKITQDRTSTSTFPRNAATGGWIKINLNAVVNDFAFDSKGTLYIINLTGVYRADNNFVIKDTLTKPFNSSLSPSKIYITENDIICLAAYSGFNHHLFISSDGGKTWITPTGFQNTQIQSISSKGNRIYIASGGGDESPAMIQISEDNGVNWRTIINSGTTGYFDLCSENNSNEISFVGNNNLYYSSNYGLTFTQNKINFPSPWDNSLVFGTNKNILIGDDSGIFLTTDKGSTWKNIYLNNESSDFFTLFNSPNGFIYAMHRWFSSSADYGLKGVYVSKDGGTTWYSLLGKPDGIFNGSFHLGSDGYLYIVSSVNNINTLFISSARL